MADDVVIEYEATLKRLGGSQEMFRQYVTFFDEDIPQLLSDLSRELRADNCEAAAREAHSIKGLVSNFGVTTVVEVAAEIENACKQGSCEVGRQQLPALEQKLQAMSQALVPYR